MSSESILTSTKKMLGIAEDYVVFDPEIKIFINTALAKLHGIGIGPQAGFAIQDKTETWADFIGTEAILNGVQTYVYIDVRLVFDPPQSGPAMASLKEVQTELAYRLNAEREYVLHPPTSVEDEYVFDGGYV